MKTIKSILSWVVPILIGLAIALLVRSFLFEIVRVDGTSMEPNLVNNERVFVFKQDKIKHLSVIVFDAYGADPQATPGTEYVKRVIGMPGDKISYKDGNLYVNNKLVPQKFISSYERKTGTEIGAEATNWNLASVAKARGWGNKSETVPAGEYFVLGDHRSVSNDSRYWGFVKKSEVMGVVKVPFWGSTTAKKNVNDRTGDY
ncbi:signal peptidase I [Pediococcus ethanolidurans]|uniref:signal peptidase I n=1 Tax=Pediococcus ethanolidurans TaxID=319653 RepID=UPI001C1ED7E0|nr:signal peptidase I [Pediococcus ethanolidurans]MBU7554971.1 signal peptidase I [Pediococcus ethanolidurans]MBU7563777.1 signal peptidase I [Pediococcus ethanolidurans]MCT4397918.1 signal peptidase I [Pediococcus ethanolidurans]MCV3315705.1 signal peptidase I [Pediococcus ethanolidurans]MCV3320910.1 signal peptidase I [Pediococcus ethanolidurans]